MSYAYKYLNTILQSADRATEIEQNFERIDALLVQVLGLPEGGATYRFKDGQIQFWDQAAFDADNTKPWRAVTSDGGALALSDPIAN